MDENSWRYVGEVVHRQVFKLSLDSPDLLGEVAKALGVDRSMVDPKIVDAITNSKPRSRWPELQEKVRKHEQFILKNEIQQKSKLEELYHVGRFILALNPAIEIITPEAPFLHPDFLLSNHGVIIGVEHTRLTLSDERRINVNIDWLIQSAQDAIQVERPDLSGLVNLTFNNSAVFEKNVTFADKNKLNRPKLIREIADTAVQALTGVDVELPGFIKAVIVSDHKEEKVILNQAQNYIVESDITEYVEKAINNKEAKFDNYRSSQKMDECWLLVVCDDGEGYSGFDSKQLQSKSVDSKFDHIYVLEAFDWHIIAVK